MYNKAVMKTTKLITFLLSSVTLLAATTGLIQSKSSKDALEVSADYIVNEGYHSTGLYEIVTSKSQITNGSKIIFLADGSRYFSHFGGNPAYDCYTYGDSSNAYLTADHRYLSLEDSEACEFTVTRVSDGGSYYYHFDGYMTMDNSGVHHVLLAYWPDGWTEFSSISSFTGDDFGALGDTTNNRNDEKTRWSILNPSEEGSTTFQVANRYSGGPSRYYEIYRKVNTAFITVDPNCLDYRDYYIGDDINLHGFTIGIHNQQEDKMYYYTYEDSKTLFTMADPTVKSGVTSYDVSIRGLTSRTYPVYINEPISDPHYFFSRIGVKDLIDYRGSYLAAVELNNMSFDNFYFPARYPVYEESGDNGANCLMQSGYLQVNSYSMMQEVFVIDKAIYEDQFVYVAKTVDGKYYDNPYYDHLVQPSDYAQFITLSDTFKPSCIITVTKLENDLSFGFTNMYGNYFPFTCYTNDGHRQFMFEMNPQFEPAKLFLLGSSDYYQDDIDDFIDEFFKATKDCDSTGETRTVFTQTWSELEAKYNSLKVDAKAVFAKITYHHNQEESGSIQDLADRYDFLITKYGDLWDFMDRKGATTYEEHHATYVNNPLNFVNNESTALVLVISVTVLTASLTLVVFTKKRKER